MKKVLYIIAIIIVQISCTRNSVLDEIQGVWIGTGQFFFNPDPDKYDSLYYPNSPFLLDFQESDSVTLKIFGDKEYRFAYSFIGDSTLEINGHLIYQIGIRNDTLDLSFDDYQDKLYRADKALSLERREVINTLCSVIWSDTNVHPSMNTNPKPESYIEYMQNHAKIKKYPFMSMDTTEGIVINIELWNWTLDKYKDFYFLFETEFQPMPYNYINLVTILNDSILELYRPYTLPQVHSRYYGFKPTPDNDQIKQRLLGKWISHNKRENKYGWLVDNDFMSSRDSLYHGPFTYIITKDQLTQFGIKTQKWTSSWVLNKDQTILINDFQSEEEYNGGLIIEHYLTASEIRSFNPDTLILRLNPNQIRSDREPYFNYLLNVNQMFIRVE